MAIETKLTPYLISFAIAYVALTILVAVIQIIFQFDTSMSIPVLIGSAIFAAHRFVSTNKRPFTSGEKHKMALGSLLMSVLVSLALMAALALSPLGEGVGALLNSVTEEIKDTWHIFLVIMLGFLILHWLALFLTYGWLTRRFLLR